MKHHRRGRFDASRILVSISDRMPWYFPASLAPAGYVLCVGLLPDTVRVSGMLAFPVATILGVLWAAWWGLVSVVSWRRARRRYRMLSQRQSIQDLRSLDWRDFEELLVAYYMAEGYTVTLAGGGGADGGVDLVLRKGIQKSLVQAKHWRTTSVGVPVVREMRGLMAVHHANAGIVVSSGRFTKDAMEFAARSQVELVDGKRLSGMVRSLSGFDRALKNRVCPRCGSPMEVRSNRKSGDEFLGCRRFPLCNGTLSL